MHSDNSKIRKTNDSKKNQRTESSQPSKAPIVDIEKISSNTSKFSDSMENTVAQFTSSQLVQLAAQIEAHTQLLLQVKINVF